MRNKKYVGLICDGCNWHTLMRGTKKAMRTQKAEERVCPSCKKGLRMAFFWMKPPRHEETNDDRMDESI